MKTTLLHQFYQMLGLEKLPSSKEEAEQHVADKLQRSVWNQHQAQMVHKAFKCVRLTLKLQKYIQMHPNDAFTCYTIPLQEWNHERKEWCRTESQKKLDGKDIVKFFDENQRYRKRYWSSEERLKRVIQNGDDQ